MRTRKYKYLVGDFETTVYEEQEHTEVWASACVELYTEDVKIHHSIGETWEYLLSLKSNIVIYYHNLKFDGNFWLAYFLDKLKYKQAYEQLDDTHVEWVKEHDMPVKSFKYSISDRGQWYSIIAHPVKNVYIEIRDSLKLLPFSVARIGKSFATKHKKTEIEYKGYRYAGCEITPTEREYIANDVLVVKEALEISFDAGHKELTIGSCCLKEFKRIIGKQEYEELLPNIYTINIDKSYGQLNAGEYVRRSYRGGWCYLVKGKEGKVYHIGITADVNSLYPSQMHSKSGNRYPIGKPKFWKGYLPDEAIGENKYYFIRIRTRFYLKEGKLPFIQIKNSFLYKGTECLETSDIFNQETGFYEPYYYDHHGNIQEAKVTLTLTMSDFALLKEHYELIDYEELDGCWFYAQVGIFDDYINKYAEIKINSEGAMRELAKLFLNNLYGKEAASEDSSFKLAYLNEEGVVCFTGNEEHNKNPGYIPIGSAITSYARCFTIRAAQKNYYGKNKKGFIYADTDSIHCDLKAEELKGIVPHDTEFNCWKLEATWDEAIFTRQKTYIEHVVEENLKPCKPYYNIKCAGMPERCKNLFELSMKGLTEEELKEYDTESQEFLKTKRTIEDFRIGLKVPKKLRPKRVRGGIILVDTTYEMR